MNKKYLAILMSAGLLASCSKYPFAVKEALKDEPKRPASLGLSPQKNFPTAEKPPADVGDSLDLSLRKAVALGISSNKGLAVKLYDPEILKQNEELALAPFEPVFSARATAQRDVVESENRKDSTLRTYQSQAQLNQALATGTSYELGAKTTTTDPAKSFATRFGLTVTQALLRGQKPEANLADVRSARLTTDYSRYELKGFAQSLVASIAEAYWDYLYAERRLAIVENSLAVAEKFVADTEDRIALGKTAAYEGVLARAEAGLRRTDKSQALNSRDQARIALIKLLNPPSQKPWDLKLNLSDNPLDYPLSPDPLDQHLEFARANRADLNQAKIRIEQGNLEVIKTRDGLLPKLDAFATFGRSGYADSYWGSVRDLKEQSYDALVGVSFETPVAGDSSAAGFRKAELGMEQAKVAVENLAHLAQADVISAHVNAVRQGELIILAKDSEDLAAQKYEAQKASFEAGRSNAFVVTTAERDLLNARLSTLSATVERLKALTRLYLNDGSILTRLGISSPADANPE